MRWFKRDRWKIAIPLAGLLLLLLLMALIPLSASAHGGMPGVAIAGTAQPTPTVDLTVTALAKEQLALQVRQLQNQLQNQNNWFADNSTALIAAAATVIVALFGIFQWAITVRQSQDKELKDREDERRKELIAQDKELRDREAERERRDDDRLQSTIAGLGSKRIEARAVAASMLLTFLEQPGYERFYQQIFNLVVTNLRLRHVDPSTPEPPNSLDQVLIRVFRESFPLARERLQEQDPRKQFDPQSLDALGVQLDGAYLARSDLRQIRFPEAFLRRANLYNADLRGANLRDAHLCYATLNDADLSGAKLLKADLSEAKLLRADLSGADLLEANLSEADLSGAFLSKTNMEAAQSLKGTNLHGVEGLDDKQKAACKAKGAIVDEEILANAFQPTAAPSASAPSTDVQAPAVPSIQVNTPPPSTDGSSSTSAQPNTEP